MEPNKRYLAIRLVSLKALVDFVSPAEDEHIYATVSFLKQRFSTPAYPAQTDIIFTDHESTFLFNITDGELHTKFDPTVLLKLDHSVHLTVCKQRKNEKPIVIGTKNIDWRHTLHTP